MNIPKLNKENLEAYVASLKQKQNGYDIASHNIQRKLNEIELKQFKADAKEYVGKCFRKKQHSSFKRSTYYFIEKVQEKVLIVTTLREVNDTRFELLAHQPMAWKYFKQLRIYPNHKITKKLFEKAVLTNIATLTKVV